MDLKEALDKSIEKWTELAERGCDIAEYSKYDEIKELLNTCHLCELYKRGYDSPDCSKCCLVDCYGNDSIFQKWTRAAIVTHKMAHASGINSKLRRKRKELDEYHYLGCLSCHNKVKISKKTYKLLGCNSRDVLPIIGKKLRCCDKPYYLPAYGEDGQGEDISQLFIENNKEQILSIANQAIPDWVIEYTKSLEGGYDMSIEEAKLKVQEAEVKLKEAQELLENDTITIKKKDLIKAAELAGSHREVIEALAPEVFELEIHDDYGDCYKWKSPGNAVYMVVSTDKGKRLVRINGKGYYASFYAGKYQSDFMTDKEFKAHLKDLIAYRYIEYIGNKYEEINKALSVGD